MLHTGVMTETQSISQQFTSDIAVKFAAYYQEKYPMLPVPTYSVDEGKVYDRIVVTDSQKSVHAFVTKDGRLVKAAGWKAPAKNSKNELAVRYDLRDPEQYAKALADADPYGSYLYAK